MKKSILVSAAALLFAGSLSAQLFVGGSFGFGTQSGSNTSGSTSVDKTSYYNFSINPMAGFYLNDDMAIGAEIGFGVNGSTDPDIGGVAGDKRTGTNFSITPFLRYHLLEISNVTLMAQAGFGLGFGSSSHTTAGVTTDGPSIFDLKIGVLPVVSYELSESISIEATIGYFGYQSRTETTKANGATPEQKESTNQFGLNISTGLGLGFVYKF